MRKSLLTCFAAYIIMEKGGGDPLAVISSYFRPDGTSAYLRPDGTSYYIRP